MKQTSYSCFSCHNIFLCKNGDLYSFGDNKSGQCGTNDTITLIRPTLILNNKEIKSIVLGYDFSFYLEKNGDLYGCGNNKCGQLGRGNLINTHTFTKITSNVKNICASVSFTIILKEDGKVYFSGKGLKRYSQSFIDLKIDKVQSFSCGNDHVVFLKHNGEIFGIGNNDFWQMGGSPNEKYFTEPKLILSDKEAISVSCGPTNTYILTKFHSGTILKCYSENDDFDWVNNKKKYMMRKIKKHQDIKNVYCGNKFAFILLESGDVLASGKNDFGQNGLKTNSLHKFKRVDISDVINIVTGYEHSLFLKKNGEVFICGRFDRLGMGYYSEHIYTPRKLEFASELKLIQNHQIIEWNPDDHVLTRSLFKEIIFSFVLSIRTFSNELRSKENVTVKLPKPVMFIVIKLIYEMMEKNVD